MNRACLFVVFLILLSSCNNKLQDDAFACSHATSPITVVETNDKISILEGKMFLFDLYKKNNKFYRNNHGIEELVLACEPVINRAYEDSSKNISDKVSIDIANLDDTPKDCLSKGNKFFSSTIISRWRKQDIRFDLFYDTNYKIIKIRKMMLSDIEFVLNPKK